MNLADQLHCPRCKGKLTEVTAAPAARRFAAAVDAGEAGPGGAWLERPAVASGSFPAADLVAAPIDDTAGDLQCTQCGWVVTCAGGIADFVGDRIVAPDDLQGFNGERRIDSAGSGALLERLRAAAGERWPASLGEVLELGCGSGQLTCALAPALGEAVRGLLVTETSMDVIRACRDRVAAAAPRLDQPVRYARLGGQEDAIRDAVADTVAGTGVVSRYGDVRGLLATVHRALRPGGRAFFVLPNRRFHLALCQAIAAALVRLHVRDNAWPEAGNAMQWLAELRRQLLHQGSLTVLSTLRDKHLFDGETLEDMALEVGFATVDVIAMDPDPMGGEAARRFSADAGMPDAFAAELAPLVVSVGAPFFGLLSRRDGSASMLLWLTKGVGPRVRTFSSRPPAPVVGLAGPVSGLGGMPPRWSFDLTARDTRDGVVVSLGGWCLVNTDVLWVRVRLDGASRDAPVWLPRPDVHAVLNTHGLYHALNALCCGLAAELLFAGVHPLDGRCRFGLEVVLANGLLVQGPAPDTLVMDETVIVAH